MMAFLCPFRLPPSSPALPAFPLPPCALILTVPRVEANTRRVRIDTSLFLSLVLSLSPCDSERRGEARTGGQGNGEDNERTRRGWAHPRRKCERRRHLRRYPTRFPRRDRFVLFSSPSSTLRCIRDCRGIECAGDNNVAQEARRSVSTRHEGWASFSLGVNLFFLLSFSSCPPPGLESSVGRP